MAATVVLARRGASFTVLGRQTILQAALEAGLDLDYSCRQGTCGTCRALVLSGEVEMEQDEDTRLAIGPKAVARGYRLLCVSLPASNVIEIDL
jgi:ferredoxin